MKNIQKSEKTQKKLHNVVLFCAKVTKNGLSPRFLKGQKVPILGSS